MILVTGKNGLVGKKITERLKFEDVICTDKNELDITDKTNLKKFLDENKDIDLIINCAANANAEKLEDDYLVAKKITLDGPVILAKEAKLRNIKLIHISSDYVFDGCSSVPYTEMSKTNGISNYGKLKAKSEKEILTIGGSVAIIRTAWLFSENGNDFISTIKKISKTRHDINVVYDQVGSPTYIDDLADVIIKVGKDMKGDECEIYNFTNEGVCTWYDLAFFINKELALNLNVKPILSEEYVTKAARPHYSVLDKNKIKKRFDLCIRHYHDALSECLRKIIENEKN